MTLDVRSHMYYGVVMTDTVTSVRLTAEQTEALDAIGARDDRSRSWLIRKAVDEYIERHREGEK